MFHFRFHIGPARCTYCEFDRKTGGRMFESPFAILGRGMSRAFLQFAVGIAAIEAARHLMPGAFLALGKLITHVFKP